MKFVKYMLLVLCVLMLCGCSQTSNVAEEGYDLVDIESSCEDYTWATFEKDGTAYLGIVAKNALVISYYEVKDIVFHSEIVGYFTYVKLADGTYKLISVGGDVVSESSDGSVYEKMFAKKEISREDGVVIFKETEDNRPLVEFDFGKVRIEQGVTINRTDILR